MTTYRDYYQTLGVKRDASQEEIQRAFRKLARRYHPDTSKEPDAATKFKEINESYEVLKDPEKRKRYDMLGANWKAGQEFRPPPEWGDAFAGFNFGGGGGGSRAAAGGFGFSDFFEMLFGGGGAGPFAGFGGAQRSRPVRGQDIETEISVTLEEAHRGVSKSFLLQRSDGSRNYEMRIPAGTRNGDRLRLSGQGGVGNGGPAGDLFVRVCVRPHSRFEIRGNDLQTDVPITPWEAALGAKVPVKTLDGTVTLTIPPGTPSGRSLRLRGQGLAQMGGGRGDLLATVKIMVPTELTERERELYEQLAEESPFRPRGD
jgi:curved DNA-binding protein